METIVYTYVEAYVAEHDAICPSTTLSALVSIVDQLIHSYVSPLTNTVKCLLTFFLNLLYNIFCRLKFQTELAGASYYHGANSANGWWIICEHYDISVHAFRRKLWRETDATMVALMRYVESNCIVT